MACRDIPEKWFNGLYLRLPELYLGYAEAICQTNRDMALAYECVNKLRDRVNIGHLKAGLKQKGFSGNTDERTGLRICL